MIKRGYILKRTALLFFAFAFGIWLGCVLLFAYEHGLKRPIISSYVRAGFGRNSVSFVLTHATSNDVGMCHYALFHKTGRDRIETHTQAMFTSMARAKRGDPILVPFVYEYAQDVSWDKEIREIAMKLLLCEGGTQGVAVVREIAARTNDPMAEVAADELRTYPKKKHGLKQADEITK